MCFSDCQLGRIEINMVDGLSNVKVDCCENFEISKSLLSLAVQEFRWLSWLISGTVNKGIASVRWNGRTCRGVSRYRCLISHPMFITDRTQNVVSQRVGRLFEMLLGKCFNNIS